MAFLRLRQGIGTALGGFGRRIISKIQQIGGTVSDVLGLAREAGAEVAPSVVVREWGQVSIAGERQEQFAALLPTDEVPIDWFEESTIPWDKPIAYKVKAYGRNIATGRFVSQEYDITVSRPLTTEEVVDEAKTRIGAEGQSPVVDMFSVALVGASRREGEPWRW